MPHRLLRLWLSSFVLLIGIVSPARAALILESTSPKNGAADVSATGPYTFTFNNPIRLESFVQSIPNLPNFTVPTIRLTPATGVGDIPVKWSITLSENRRTAFLTPSVPLAEGVFYQLYLSRRGDHYPVRQESVNSPLEVEGATNPVIFTVKNTTAPEFLGASPADGATGLPVNTRLVFLTTKPLDTATVRLTLNGAAVTPQPDATGVRWSASLSLQPSTRYAVALTGKDHGGNSLPPQEWAFTTGASAEPDHQPPVLSASDPVHGALRVSPEVQPALTFSEPLSPLSFTVSLNRCVSGQVIPEVTWTLSPEGNALNVKPPPLIPASTCYEVRVSGEDRAGNPLPPAGSPGNRLSFTTADRVGPALTEVTPAQEVAVHPVSGPDLAFHFTEEVRTSGPEAPVLKLQYASGAPPPALDPRDAVSLGGGRWRLEGQGWSTPRDLAVRVLTTPGEASGFRYLPGDRLFVHLESAWDGEGNPLGSEDVPNPWSFTVMETRTSELLEILPAEGTKAALDAPVQIRFSFPMNPSRLQFEADGDWSAFATELFQGTARYSPRRWISSSPAWSPDRRTVMLSHATFEESAPGATASHTFRILSAPDAQGKEFVPGAAMTPPRTWVTGRKPRVTSVEHLAPADASEDLTREGLLAAPDDPARSLWKPLDGGAELPLNTRFRVGFSEAMSPQLPIIASLSLPSPVPALVLAGEKMAQVTLNGPLPSVDRRYIRSPEGSLTASPSSLTLTLEGGRNGVGDPFVPFTIPLQPVDVEPPAFRVEYLAKAGTVTEPPDWKPLSGAAVPADAPWRIVADETLAHTDPVALTREGSAGPDPATAGMQFSERGDADGHAGNILEIRWTKPLATTGMARPGEDFVEGVVRVEVRDTRTLGGPNRGESVVSFRILVPRRPLSGDLDGNGVLDAKDVDRAMNLLLLKTPLSPSELLAADLVPSDGDGQFDVTDLNALFRLFLNGRQ